MHWENKETVQSIASIKRRKTIPGKCKTILYSKILSFMGFLRLKLLNAYNAFFH